MTLANMPSSMLLAGRRALIYTENSEEILSTLSPVLVNFGTVGALKSFEFSESRLSSLPPLNTRKIRNPRTTHEPWSQFLAQSLRVTPGAD